MNACRKIGAAIAVSASLWSASAEASVFDFSFSSTNTSVAAEINATLINQANNIYRIDSYIVPPSFVSGAALTPFTTGITGKSTYQGTATSAPGNMFQYISPASYSIASGFGFTTTAGMFNLHFVGGSATPYRLDSSVTAASSNGTFAISAAPAAVAVPGPIAGAGLPALLALGGLLGWKRWAFGSLAA